MTTIINFNSGGREYLAVTGLPENIERLKLGDEINMHKGCYLLSWRQNDFPVSVWLPKLKKRQSWQILGRLNELTAELQLELTFAAFTVEQIHHEGFDDKALILIKQ